MDRIDHKFNRITFSPESGDEVPLTLESDWTRSTGIAPDVNTVYASWKDFNAADVTGVEGEIRFYYNSSDSPDVVLAKIRLVDVEPAEWGVLPNESSPRVLKYRLSFADVREKFIWPYGGFLDHGEINKEPIDLQGGKDVNGHDLLRPTQLAQMCLVKMGLDPTLAPYSMDKGFRPFNVEWRGNHAPTELEKILQETAHVLHLTAKGELLIKDIGDGEAPNIPAGQSLPKLDYKVADRRGKVVVLVSAPNAVLSTETITGLLDHDDDDHSDLIQFVVQDKDDSWVKIDDASVLVINDALGKGKRSPADARQDQRKDIAEPYGN